MHTFLRQGDWAATPAGVQVVGEQVPAAPLLRTDGQAVLRLQMFVEPFQRFEVRMRVHRALVPVVAWAPRHHNRLQIGLHPTLKYNMQKINIYQQCIITTIKGGIHRDAEIGTAKLRSTTNLRQISVTIPPKNTDEICYLGKSLPWLWRCIPSIFF